MNVWLWEAGSGRGVSDQERQARAAAAAYVRGGQAGSARVERALLMAGDQWLMSGYRRTGEAWVARSRRDGRIRWTRLRAPANLGVPQPAPFS
jgi:hypothetical protein